MKQNWAGSHLSRTTPWETPLLEIPTHLAHELTCSRFVRPMSFRRFNQSGKIQKRNESPRLLKRMKTFCKANQVFFTGKQRLFRMLMIFVNKLIFECFYFFADKISSIPFTNQLEICFFGALILLLCY
jgi:hypothetical protein